MLNFQSKNALENHQVLTNYLVTGEHPQEIRPEILNNLAHVVSDFYDYRHNYY